MTIINNQLDKYMLDNYNIFWVATNGLEAVGQDSRLQPR